MTQGGVKSVARGQRMRVALASAGLFVLALALLHPPASSAAAWQAEPDTSLPSDTPLADPPTFTPSDPPPADTFTPTATDPLASETPSVTDAPSETTEASATPPSTETPTLE